MQKTLHSDQQTDEFSSKFLNIQTNISYYQSQMTLGELEQILKNKNNDAAIMNAHRRGLKLQEYQHQKFKQLQDVKMNKLLSHKSKKPKFSIYPNYQNRKQNIAKIRQYSSLVNICKATLQRRQTSNASTWMNSEIKFRIKKQTEMEKFVKLQKIFSTLIKKETVINRSILFSNFVQSSVSSEMSPIFQMLHKLTLGINHQDFTHNFATLVNNSLQILQCQYQKKNSIYSSLQQYAYSHYLANKQYKSIASSKQVEWASSYILYLQGFQSKFYEMLPSSKLAQEFKTYDNFCYKKQIAQAINTVGQSKSVFQLQLTTFLTGEYQLHSSIFEEDSVFILLKTAGVSGHYSRLQEERQKMLTKFIKNQFVVKKNIYDLLYLLGFYQLAVIGPNQIMDQCDYFLYLLVILNSPAFLSTIPHHQQNQISVKLEQSFHHIIQYLTLTNKLKNFTMYLMILPPEKLVQIGSKVIVLEELQDRVDWEYMKNKLENEQVDNFQFQVYRKYGEHINDYFKAAEQYYSLTKKGKEALEIALNLIKIPNKCMSQKQEQFIDKIFKQFPHLIQKYSKLFTFINQLKLLQFHLLTNQVKQLYNMITSPNFVPSITNLKIFEQFSLRKQNNQDQLLLKLVLSMWQAVQKVRYLLCKSDYCILLRQMHQRICSLVKMEKIFAVNNLEIEAVLSQIETGIRSFD